MRTLLPYFRLFRIPNVFTSMSDIVLAALATGSLLAEPLAAGLIIVSSSLLYCSGMVWNDYFDIKQDEIERPFRPLPSGRISMSTAWWLGVLLMVGGVVCAMAADFRGGAFRGIATIMALLLVGAIFLYDALLKPTLLGPIAMGSCRFLNILLGMTIVSVWPGPWALWLAFLVGLYIVGVTLFAKTEAVISQRPMLVFAAIIVALALLLTLSIPAVAPVELNLDTNLPESDQVWLGQLMFPYLILLFAILIGLPLAKAIKKPAPENVQKAVKRMILGLVVLDAILATAFVGPIGLLIILLLIPAQLIGHWIYST